MARLSGAYHGYLHQDAVTAYALAALLLPRPEHHTVSVERRTVAEDRFDDLELEGATRCRIQIKSHHTGHRPLRLRDFTTQDISFRIDEVVRSFSADANPADEYRLFATFTTPDQQISPFLAPAPSTAPLLPGISTERFSLVLSRIWPEGTPPVWPHLEEIGRETFARFCDRFLIEVGCPNSSTDLRNPGPFEHALLDVLTNGIGVGTWPNNNRDVADASAHLIRAATSARCVGATLHDSDVVEALALRVDYGRVLEILPVDEQRLVRRLDDLDYVLGSLATSSHIVLTGSPGIGKSWLLFQLADRLADDGWIVATHYCFIDLLDSQRSLRASVDTTFGSITAELLDRDPSLATNRVPRFAAGPRQLETLLQAAITERPERRIAIIVDGLDHADRVLERHGRRAAIEIAEELAGLTVPPGVVVVVGSQPGDHLRPFLEVATEHRLGPWPEAPLRALVEQIGVRHVLRDRGLDADSDQVVRTVVEKSDGSPLYATYLARTAVSLATRDRGPQVADIAEHIRTVPTFDDDLSRYYQWLLQPIEREPGALWIAQLLSLIDFSLTTDEIKQILPGFGHLVDPVVSDLTPVLVDEIGRGGLRVYHESFQRYVRGRLEATLDASLSAVLGPAIDWLDGQGFFEDTRTFRAVFRLLERAGRDAEIVARVSDDFVDLAARNGQPGDAVRANLSIAADAAAASRNWPALARLVELARAAENLYYWRFNDYPLAEAYGRAFASLFGAARLAARLLYDGRCTLSPRPGLLLCRLCDEAGVVPPWSEYRSAFEVDRRDSNTSYGNESDSAILTARIMGRLRLAGREDAVRLCVEWFNREEELPFDIHEIASILGQMYGSEAIEAVIDAVHVGARRAWLHLALASQDGDPERARAHANQAIQEGLQAEGCLVALDLGANQRLVPRADVGIDSLTDAVLARQVQFEPGRYVRWFLELRLAAAVGDEIALMHAEGRIPTDSWYRRWLRFCVVLVHPRTTPDDLVAALQALSTNIEVFVGDPRACDLYRLHGYIRMSFRKALNCLDDDRWQQALESLAAISDDTNTWLKGTRMGPLPVDVLFELCSAAADTPAKRLAANAVCSRLLAPDRRTTEYYDTHAADQLILARIQAATGLCDLAEASWREACTYLAAYGFRKDITVFEVLDPLKALAEADRDRTRQCLRDIQPVVERILVHTDGKETRHAIHSWIDLAAEIHPPGALSYVARDQVSDMPAFGDLDHAIPKALVALSEEIGAVVLAAAWMGIGAEARDEVDRALTQCEKAVDASRSVGQVLWSAVVASLEGDGAQPARRLSDAVSRSAERLGLSRPTITEPPSSSDQEGRFDTEDGASTHRETSVTFSPPLPAVATPLQIAHGVEGWRASRAQRPHLDRVTNAVGWRLIQMIERGDEASAERLIRRLARDTSMWEKYTVLPGLAEGLARHGASRLAALASTYAYTRASDGWRHFAGPEGEAQFRFALQLDESVAWSTLADEVSAAVAGGGPYGITAHLIELLARMGSRADAFAAWSTACRAIAYRTPSTGARDAIRIPYEPEGAAPAEMLWSAIATRLNQVMLQEKRSACASLAIAARHSPIAFSGAIRFAVANDAPLSTLTSLLQLLDEYEQEPFEATRNASTELRTLASTSFVSVRVLARSLLERAGFNVDMPPPTDPGVALVSEGRAAELIRQVGSARISWILETWPDFARLFATSFDAACGSDDLKARMRRALQRLRRDRKGRQLALWMPIDEEVERVLQSTGAGVRAAFAQQGVLDPSVEERVGRNFLGNMDLGVRMCLSRIVRPDYLRRPCSIGTGTDVTAPLLVPDGDFEGWVVLAHYETELVVGAEYDKPVESRLALCGGVLFDEWRDEGGWPVGRVYPGIWRSNGWREAAQPSHFRGPVAAWGIVRDPFGVVEFLAPHPVALIPIGLDAASFEHGLTFFDADGAPAVVCRNWGQRLIGDELEDREPIFQGTMLLARPDVFDAVTALASNPPIYVTVTNARRPTEDE